MEAINFVVLNFVILMTGTLFSFRIFATARRSISALITYAFFFYISVIIIFLNSLLLFGIFDKNIISIVIYVFCFLVSFFCIEFFWKNFKIEKPKLDSIFFIAISFLASVVIIGFFDAIIQPVFGSDLNSHYLPIINHWIQNQSIWKIFFSPYTGPIGYYPNTGEIFMFWFIFGISKDTFVNSQNYIIAIPFFVGLYDFAKNIGVNKKYSFILPVVFFYSSFIFLELKNPTNNFLFGLSFFYCIYFLVEYFKTKQSIFLALILLASGIFIGIKFLALPYFVIILILTIVAIVKSFSQKGEIKRFIPALIFGLIFFSISGLLWYVRNFYFTGNPIFPVDFSIAGIKIFTGYLSSKKDLFFYPIQSYQIIFFDYVSKTGYQVYLFIVAYFLNIILFIYFLVKKFLHKKNGEEEIVNFEKEIRETIEKAKSELEKQRIKKSAENEIAVFREDVKKQTNLFEEMIWISFAFIFFVPVLFIIYLYISFSLDQNIKHSIPFFILASALFAFVISKIKFIQPVMIIVVFLCVFYSIEIDMSLVSKFQQISVPHFIVSVSVILFLTILFCDKKTAKISILSLGLFFIILLPSFFLGSKVHEKNKFEMLKNKYKSNENYGDLFDGFEWIEKNTKETDVIAYAGFHFHYPLYNNFTKNIKYIRVQNCQNCNHFDYSSYENGIFYEAQKKAWMENLKINKIKYIIIYDQFGKIKNNEEKWIKEENYKFEKVFYSEKKIEAKVKIFKVEKI